MSTSTLETTIAALLVAGKGILRAGCSSLVVQEEYSEQAESDNPLREKHHP